MIPLFLADKGKFLPINILVRNVLNGETILEYGGRCDLYSLMRILCRISPFSEPSLYLDSVEESMVRTYTFMNILQENTVNLTFYPFSGLQIEELNDFANARSIQDIIEAIKSHNPNALGFLMKKIENGGRFDYGINIFKSRYTLEVDPDKEIKKILGLQGDRLPGVLGIIILGMLFNLVLFLLKTFVHLRLIYLRLGPIRRPLMNL